MGIGRLPLLFRYIHAIFPSESVLKSAYIEVFSTTPETKCQRLFSTHTFHCMKKATVDFSTMAIKSFLFTFDFRQPHAQTGIGLTL